MYFRIVSPSLVIIQINFFIRYNPDKYNRGFSHSGQSSLNTVVSSGSAIRKELVDQRVVEGHILPHNLVFTSHAPTAEYQTVAWLPESGGIKVNVSLQVCMVIFYSADVDIASLKYEYKSNVIA